MRDNNIHDCKQVCDDRNKRYCIPEELELEFARLVAIQDHSELEQKFSKYLEGST